MSDSHGMNGHLSSFIRSLIMFYLDEDKSVSTDNISWGDTLEKCIISVVKLIRTHLGGEISFKEVEDKLRFYPSNLLGAVIPVIEHLPSTQVGIKEFLKYESAYITGLSIHYESANNTYSLRYLASLLNFQSVVLDDLVKPFLAGYVKARKLNTDRADQKYALTALDEAMNGSVKLEYIKSSRTLPSMTSDGIKELSNQLAVDPEFLYELEMRNQQAEREHFMLELDRRKKELVSLASIQTSELVADTELPEPLNYDNEIQKGETYSLF